MVIDQKRQFKAILFDLDGTLVNTLKDITDITNRVLKKRGFPEHNADSYRYRVGNGARVLIEKSLPPALLTEELIEECLTEFSGIYSADPIGTSIPYPGILELLDKIESLKIPKSILSNKPDAITKQVVQTLFDSYSFTAVQGAKEGIPKKPDPQAALEICGKMGVQPEEVLYLGDSGVDMETAVSGGMFPAGVQWGFRDTEELKAHGAEMIISQPSEILNYLTNFHG